MELVGRDVPLLLATFAFTAAAMALLLLGLERLRRR